MPDTDGFRLDDEQRERVRDCLKKAGAPLAKPFNFDKFVSRIESSIDHFLRAPPRRTFREEHDALQTIWLLAHSNDPNPARLRELLNQVGRRAIQELNYRAEIILPRLFAGERAANGFLAWARTVEDRKLVTALGALSADGAKIVTGRSRGDGKRDGPRLAPRVLGLVRGAQERKPKGGRPREDTRQALVMFLVCDWAQETGEAPAPGRSDASGFGDLVHSVFQWLEISEDTTEAANYALRQYWDEVRGG